MPTIEDPSARGVDPSPSDSNVRTVLLSFRSAAWQADCNGTLPPAARRYNRLQLPSTQRMRATI
jgi:hypothetical protein